MPRRQTTLTYPFARRFLQTMGLDDSVADMSSTANHKFAHTFPALQTPLNQGIMGLLTVYELMKR
ncbi:MAG: hypothetical protein B6245_20260 [Desulfobacteraceae bacterium 4572_88]|nr:MAG: hypothetical protein B6245_20260 [Desulfobacteraceae bacterium 4572_88]